MALTAAGIAVRVVDLAVVTTVGPPLFGCVIVVIDPPAGIVGDEVVTESSVVFGVSNVVEVSMPADEEPGDETEDDEDEGGGV